eukprot:Opistho-1_new@47772
MSDSNLKSLPAPARKRIEQLERTISELRGEVGQLNEQLHAVVRLTGLENLAKRTTGRREAREERMRLSRLRKGHDAKGLSVPVARGEAAKLAWITSGEVVSAKKLAEVWDLTPQALGPAAERGDVFAVMVKRLRYYPKEFLELSREDVGAVTRALGELSPEQKLVFWKRQHGALAGKTVLEALSQAHV